MVAKCRAGKLTCPQPPEKWIPSRRAYFQIKDLPLDELLIYRSGKLPDVHRDPFDRLIAAHGMQARTDARGQAIRSLSFRSESAL